MLKALKIFDQLLKDLVLLTVTCTAAISGYVLWHNAQVYTAAENVRSELYALKPVVTEDEAPSFDELRAINPDVVSWLTVDGTNIDYPVVQGDSNLTYMNMDVYGNFSLAGSIFLDSRNNREFKDRYSIIYGHHMENHAMFGDLDLFMDEEFFNSNSSASILTDEGEKSYQVLACAEVPDSIQAFFDPYIWKSSLAGIETPLREYASNISESVLEELIEAPTRTDIVALVTCASGSTGTRTVLFMTTERTVEDEPPDTPDPSDPTSPSIEKPPKTGDSILNSPSFLLVCIIVFGGIFCLLCVPGEAGAMRKRLSRAGKLLCAALILLSLLQLLRIRAGYNKNIESTSTLKNEILPVSAELPDTADSEETIAARLLPLYEMNNDFVGWLTIDGTNIDYPVLCSAEEPERYMKLNFNRQPDVHGSLFMYSECDIKNGDNIILHGHHMLDGTMFSQLDKFTDKDFCSQEHLICFDTIYGESVYKPILVFKISAKGAEAFPYHLITEFDSASDYIERGKYTAIWYSDEAIPDDAKLLTLSTCEYTLLNGRLVVVAMKLD